MLTDFRQAIRRLRRERGFCLTAIATLTLCLAANVVIFAIVDCVLLRPLPFPDSDRLVTAINSYPKAGVDRAGASYPNYYDRRSAIPAFAKTAATRSGSVTVGEAGWPKRVEIERVSPEFFDTLGVRLAQGRAFTEEETDYAHSAVAILTDGYWKNHFNRDPQVLGKTVRVDGLPVSVIGVLPPGLHYLSSKAEFFLPLASGKEERAIDRRHSNNISMIARLAPGASVSLAQAQIDAFNLRQLTEDPYAEMVKGAGYRTAVSPLHADVVREVRPILLFLQAGAVALLLIGAVNLMNLLLVRASGRAKKFAVRQALGARRRDVVRDALAESLTLALVGGALGLGLAGLGIRLLTTWGSDRLPLGASITLDARVIAGAVLTSVLVAGVLAVPVLWHNLALRIAVALQTESRSGTVTRGAQRLRHTFIVTQVALAYVLLSSAALLGLSLQRVLAQSPGFRADHVLTGQLSLPWNNYRDEKARLAFVERLLPALRAQPGVTFASISTSVPLTGGGDNNAVMVEDMPPQAGAPIQAHFTCGIAGEFHQAMGIPLREGRLLEDADNHRDLPACTVDEDFAARYWPRGSALGKRILPGAVWDAKKAYTIVGVVGRVKQNELSDTVPHGAVYFPYNYYSSPSFKIVIRSAVAPTSLAPMLQQTVLKLDPELPVDRLRSMETVIDESLMERRSPALLAGIFAAVALLLAAIGTYGVLAYAVAQRRREIGVRMAIGALPGQIRGQFLRLGAQLLGVGLVLGLAGAWGTGRLIETLLFGVNGLHPGVLMGLVVFLASFIPSRSAAMISPSEALRGD